MPDVPFGLGCLYKGVARAGHLGLGCEFLPDISPRVDRDRRWMRMVVSELVGLLPFRGASDVAGGYSLGSSVLGGLRLVGSGMLSAWVREMGIERMSSRWRWIRHHPGDGGGHLAGDGGDEGAADADFGSNTGEDNDF